MEEKEESFGVEDVPYLNIPTLVEGEIVKVANEDAPDDELPVLELFRSEAFCAYFDCDNVFTDGDYAYVKERDMEGEAKSFPYCRSHLLAGCVKHMVKIKEEKE